MVSAGAARRELEDLRAAINHHRREGLCSEIVGVALPEKSEPPRCLADARSGGATALGGMARRSRSCATRITKRDVGKHVARFILTGLYTGTRHAAICGAAFQPAIGRGHVDLDRGVFHRRAARRARDQEATAAGAVARSVACAPAALAPARHREACGCRVEWPAGALRAQGLRGRRQAARIRRGDVTPHILRHTAATWAMQNGGDLWQAAGFLGMTVEMLEHALRAPSSRLPARGSEGDSTSPGQIRDRNTVNKQDITSPNLNKNRWSLRR